MRNVLAKFISLSRRVTRRLGVKQVNYFYNDAFLEYVAGKSLAFQRKSDCIETIALLSSYADYGFVADEFPKSFNLGLTSCDLHTAFHIYNINLKNFMSLQRVILFFGVFSPGFSLIKTSECYRTVAYKYYFHVPYQDDTCISRVAEWLIFKKCRKISPSDLSEGEFGYKKKTFFFTGIDAAKRAATHLRENRRTPNQIVWLERFAELAGQNGHRLYVVLPPVRSDYRAALPPKHQIFHTVLSGNLKNVHVLDCFDGAMAANKYMGDSDHPNEQGAKVLTRYLKRVIKDIEEID